MGWCSCPNLHPITVVAVTEQRSPPQLFLGLERVRLDGVVGAGQGYHLRPARILSGRTVHVALLLHIGWRLLRNSVGVISLSLLV